MSLSTTDTTLGYGSVVGIALETTYDTQAAPTLHLPLVSWSPNREYPQVPHSHLHGGVGRVAMDYYTERDDVTVTFTVVANYENVGALLRMAMGPAPTTTGAGPYAHPFLLGNLLPSATLRFYRGTAAVSLTPKYMEVTGAMCNRLTLRAAVGQMVLLEVEVFGKTTAYTNQGAPTISFPADPILYQQGGNLGWNSGSYDCTSFELEINNGLARRRNIGSLKTAQPHPSALREVVARINRYMADETLAAALSAQTESDLTITFTGVGNNSLAIELHSARVVSPDAAGVQEGAVGAIEESVEFRPRNVAGGTDYGLIMTLNNDNASYLT